MERKIDKLREAMDSNDWKTALGIAARFPRLGTQREAIQLGWSALTNPGFYRQIGKDPDALVHAGVRALKERYQKQPS
jgi:hypothetical protein